MTTLLLLAAATMLLLAIGFGLVLGWANVKFRVEQDPRVEQITAALPGANCGGCGFAGCAAFADAVVEGTAPCGGCPVGGPDVAARVAEILGVEVEQTWPYRPVIHCSANYDQRLGRSDYRGEQTCFAANVIGGVQGCTYGCLGFGDCFRSCPYDAIEMVNGLPRINYEKCTGCGACEKACPRHIISMIPFKSDRMLVVACSNRDPGRLVRQVCKVGCLGCKGCERISSLFKVADNLSKLDYENYDPGTDFTPALQKCPMAIMTFVGKPAPKDLAAVRDEPLPDKIEPDFKTTADDAQWRG